MYICTLMNICDKECLVDFYISSGKRKPDQIIIFRDGGSESQFNQVLNIELDQIIEACKFLDETWSPKFTLVVAQKNHHIKFFMPGALDNVPPGTVDNAVCHPRNYDFYMCAHAGIIKCLVKKDDIKKMVSLSAARAPSSTRGIDIQ